MPDPTPDAAPVTREADYLADRFEWAAPGDQQEDAWLVRFCDKDCGEAIFTGPDAEAEARAYWNRYAPSYNIYVFRLARLAAEAQHRERAETSRENGYVYFNPDTGEEFSVSHPVQSGEVPDAERIRPATVQERHLYDQFQNEWQRAEKAERERDDNERAWIVADADRTDLERRLLVYEQRVRAREEELETWERELSDRAAWQPAQTAPKDGTLLEIVVDYTNGHSPMQDGIVVPTIGWNELADTGEDIWHIVGWDWCQDHIRNGQGEIIAWRPSRLNACDDALGNLPAHALLPAADGGSGEQG